LPRILLAGVFKPYGVDDKHGRRENLMELFHNQVTKAQGMASLRFLHRSFGLYFMAENLPGEVTVLDFPTRRRFVRELRRGYDIVGISFIVPNCAKAVTMAALVRRWLPRALVVIGGHGAAIEHVEELVDCDYVVGGDGIAWFRRFLGQDPAAPVRHPVLPSNDYHRVYGIPVRDANAGILVPGVGCANNCRFCSTSHFFGGYSPFIRDGRELFDTACRIAEARGSDGLFVLDENFLQEKARVAEFLRLMNEHKRWFRMYLFSAANAALDFGIENLVRLGVQWLWIGVESATGSGFTKNQGIDLAALVRRLRDHGIVVLASGILCMEHHDAETIQQDIDGLVGLEPDLLQFMLLTGLPVTALYREQQRQGRLCNDLPFEEWHGQKRLNYRHPAFPGDLPEAWLSRAFRLDYERNSSSICRMVRTAVCGYRTIAELNHADANWQGRIMQYRNRMSKYRPLLPVIRRYAVNQQEVERVDELEADMKELLGPASMGVRLSAAAAGAFAAAWGWRVRLLGDRIQPPTLISRYRDGQRL
jgi:hypothetical protein